MHCHVLGDLWLPAGDVCSPLDCVCDDVLSTSVFMAARLMAVNEGTLRDGSVCTG